MALFVTLMNWTDQGVKTFKDSVDRAEAAKSALRGQGVDLKEIYWTVGPYDLVSIVEAPDVETATAALLSLRHRATSARRRCARSRRTRCAT